MERSGPYHRAFAWMLAHGGAADRRLYAKRKTRLLGGLSGRIVEIGPGAGVNMGYLRPGISYVGIEPNVHFHERISEAALKAGIEATVTAGVAEELPLDDASVDAVISTLVLCSVNDVDTSLSEIRRVLRAGGRLLFLEHVAAPPGTLLRKAQHAIRKPWGCIADGCRPDRDTHRYIEDAGFAKLTIEQFSAPLGPMRPHIMGSAVR